MRILYLCPPGITEPGKTPNHLELLLEACSRGELGVQQDLLILHDDWCAYWSGKSDNPADCDCNPEVRVTRSRAH
jgi:hypothetical protein